jgi:hypothetical protein
MYFFAKTISQDALDNGFKFLAEVLKSPLFEVEGIVEETDL